MKANELMLGDWVYGLYPNGSRYASPFRISAVDIYPSNRSPRIVTMGGYGFQEEHLEPIPLTPEILEKNPRVKNIGYWDKFGEHTIFRLYLIPVINQWYVHGLQHSLRLCGLIDLADNFQV